MNTSKPHIAFFGLGLMGMGMARRLLGAGFPLTVFNRTQEKAALLVAEGAQVAARPAKKISQPSLNRRPVIEENSR